MRHVETTYGLLGQSFYLDVLEGRPSSPTVAVYPNSVGDVGPAEPATTGSASVDPVNTTLADAVAFGANTIEVDSATGITKGRRYLLGGLEWVEVIGVAGTTITTRRPVINAHDAGATFQGCRISILVADAWVIDESNISDTAYRLRWSYTVNGVATIGVSYALLVRYPTHAILTALDVDDRIPGWIDRLPPDHREDQGAKLISSAFEAMRFDALGDSRLLHAIRDTEALRELALYRANLISIEGQLMAGASNMDALSTARELYAQRYQQLVREPKLSTDVGDGGGSQARRLPVWRR